MTITRNIIGGLAGIILAACGPQDNSKTDSNNNNPDGGYSDANYVLDGGSDSNSDYDGGYVDGGADGGNNDVEVYLETRNGTTNEPQSVFSVGEMVRFYIKGVDSKCVEFNSCNNSNNQNTAGMKYCTFVDNVGNSGNCSVDSEGECLQGRTYAESGDRNVRAKCVVRRNNEIFESEVVDFQISN